MRYCIYFKASELFINRRQNQAWDGSYAAVYFYHHIATKIPILLMPKHRH